MKDIKNAWKMNESLLQSYRSTFMISQSIFLVVGVLLLPPYVPLWLMIGVAVINLVIIWYIWFRTVRSRALVVDYYKIQLMYDFSNHHDFCETVSIYELNIKKRKLMNKAAGLTRNWRKTRLKLDLGLPIIYSLLWIAFVFVKL
ncbi:MAG: hypothetical protein CL609_24970 [Anaerolineaceae bacterium]|nr:hypothetical protein [Anaerolineaceae bacterium]